MCDDLAATLTSLISRIEHIQFAYAPGRNEPGTGVVDFARVFPLIYALGESGVVGGGVSGEGKDLNEFWLATR